MHNRRLMSVSVLLDGVSDTCTAGLPLLPSVPGLSNVKMNVLHLFIKLSFIRLSGYVSLLERLNRGSRRESGKKSMQYW